MRSPSRPLGLRRARLDRRLQCGGELLEQALQLLHLGAVEIGQRPIQSIDDQLDETIDGAGSRRGKLQFYFATIVVAAPRDNKFHREYIAAVGDIVELPDQ